MSSRTNNLVQNKQKTLLKDVKHTLLQMRQNQPFGGDTLRVQRIPDDSRYLNSITLAPGQVGGGNYIIQPVNDQLTMWQALYTIYIDPTNFQSNGNPTEAFIWPDGGAYASTSTVLNISVNGRFDWATSSDTTNKRIFKLTIRNNDSVSHVYYMATRFYLPDLNQ